LSLSPYLQVLEEASLVVGGCTVTRFFCFLGSLLTQIHSWQRSLDTCGTHDARSSRPCLPSCRAERHVLQPKHRAKSASIARAGLCK
jgi:hypothetical protein